ncbi:hypothetical protein [Deinococcus radiophilus]|uniref:Uncharacterized protein n=1 Tax=Deinococcus radiophilus TaxID=32062 RepID=A0A3S0I4Z0_9DEIO|nr:hypothetical protein [Deinococcus radiophilus]RTR27523.1 hypothetical protein EJ104_06610 [Deinococcus radiophilus]UFA50396.1 hypothetical protein LMT64_00260 [Deinococcus radiophilus]
MTIPAMDVPRPLPHFSWGRVMVGTLLPLALMAAYLQLLIWFNAPANSFSLDAFSTFLPIFTMLLGVPLLALSAWTEVIQSELSDRAFWGAGIAIGALAGYVLSDMAALPAMIHVLPGGLIGVLVALTLRRMWRRAGAIAC